jgi:hypothetical protein
MGGEPPSSQSDRMPDNCKEQEEQHHKSKTRARESAAKSPTDMNTRLSFQSPTAVRNPLTPLTFKAPLTLSCKSPFLKNPLDERPPLAVNLAPAAMKYQGEKGEIPLSPVAKVRQLGSDFFSSWKQSMQSPKPDNTAKARRISQELCSPSMGSSQDVLLLRKALQQQRRQSKMATTPPPLVSPQTTSLNSVPSPRTPPSPSPPPSPNNKKAQQISKELCKTRSNMDCTELFFTIDTPPGTPAKSVRPFNRLFALEPPELTEPWDSFHTTQEMLIKNAVIKKDGSDVASAQTNKPGLGGFSRISVDDNDDDDDNNNNNNEDEKNKTRQSPCSVIS